MAQYYRTNPFDRINNQLTKVQGKIDNISDKFMFASNYELLRSTPEEDKITYNFIHYKTDDQDRIGDLIYDPETCLLRVYVTPEEPVNVDCGNNNQILVATSSGMTWKDPGEERNTEPVLYKCDNCGAVLTKDFNCEYCNTEYNRKEI